MVIYRVRKVSCDGGRIGKVWEDAYFEEMWDANAYFWNKMHESDEQNPNYPFMPEPEMVDNTFGYCNWQFGVMYTMDQVIVHENSHRKMIDKPEIEGIM